MAKILRVDQKFLFSETQKLEKLTGKKGVIEKIYDANHKALEKALLELGTGKDGKHLFAKEVYDVLISKIEADDFALYERLGRPDNTTFTGCKKLTDFINQNIKIPNGFFLKVEKAKELLRKNPPQRVMDFLGYNSVEAMIEKEDLFEIYPALRFLEGNDWLNGVFFKEYQNLKPEDFEKRKIDVRAISEKWTAKSAGERFMTKKYHNISHLKELGIIFILPVSLQIGGETLRAFSLILHYLNEIPFYGRIFERIAKKPETFPSNFISLLRGDIVGQKPPENPHKISWLVVQRYLAKDDENDWRLFYPHVNPETVHWEKAMAQLTALSGKLSINDFSFWRGLDAVGDYFKDESGTEVLISLNLIDTTMSLVMEKAMIKYLYHHQEALWNKIFEEFLGKEKTEHLMEENLLKGIIELPLRS